MEYGSVVSHGTARSTRRAAMPVALAATRLTSERGGGRQSSSCLPMEYSPQWRRGLIPPGWNRCFIPSRARGARHLSQFVVLLATASPRTKTTPGPSYIVTQNKHLNPPASTDRGEKRWRILRPPSENSENTRRRGRLVCSCNTRNPIQKLLFPQFIRR